MRRMLAFFGIVLLAGSLFCEALALAQTGPSFDCSKASKTDEKAVCASPELSKLDLDLNAAFQKAQSALGRQLVDKMRDALLAERGRCNSDVSCLKTWHAESIKAYQAAVQGVSSQPETIESLAASVLSEGFRCSPHLFTNWEAINGWVSNTKYQHSASTDLNGLTITQTATRMSTNRAGIFTTLEKTVYRAKWRELRHFRVLRGKEHEKMASVSGHNNGYFDLMCKGDRYCISVSTTRMEDLQQSEEFLGSDKPAGLDGVWRKRERSGTNGYTFEVCDEPTASAIAAAGNELIRLASERGGK